jgi:transcriptional regulator with XRE-family HTH domain
MFTGKQLRLLRHIRGMKQEEVAVKIDVRQQRYSVLENSDKISEEKQNLILAALKYSKEEGERILGLLPQ